MEKSHFLQPLLQNVLSVPKQVLDTQFERHCVKEKEVLAPQTKAKKCPVD